ncbi:MAG: hypothetical protein QF662_07135, partial [Phycisphaerae bacterium]|nr:hypothetical protein [Phycisphaerae bacterium]
VDAGKVQKQLEEFTRAGDNAMAAEDYAKAASAYRQARDIAKRSSDRKNLEKKLDEARFRATLAEGDAARDRQEWSAAEIAYKKALMMRPKDITIPPRLQELETLKQYQLHLSKGDEWLNQGNTAEAIKEYKLAQKVLSKPQVITRIRAAKYRQNVNTGRGAMAAGKYPEAMAYFLTAKRLNDTDEVRKLIQEVKKAQEGGK